MNLFFEEAYIDTKRHKEAASAGGVRVSCSYVYKASRGSDFRFFPSQHQSAIVFPNTA